MAQARGLLLPKQVTVPIDGNGKTLGQAASPHIYDLFFQRDPEHLD